MSNLSSIAGQAFERGIDHVLAGDMEMACLKIGHAFWLAATTGAVIPKAEADVLRDRLSDALSARNGAA